MQELVAEAASEARALLGDPPLSVEPAIDSASANVDLHDNEDLGFGADDERSTGDTQGQGTAHPD